MCMCWFWVLSSCILRSCLSVKRLLTGDSQVLSRMRQQDIDDQVALSGLWQEWQRSSSPGAPRLRLDYEGRLFAVLPPWAARFHEVWRLQPAAGGLLQMRHSGATPALAHFAGLRLPPLDGAFALNPCQLFLARLYDALLARWPAHVGALANRGTVLRSLGRIDEARRAYRLEPGDCSPPVMPWATRQVQLVLKAGGEPVPYTLVDYLALPQPRTSHLEAALESLIPGHRHHLNPSRLASPEEREAFIKEQLAKVEPIEPSTVHSIDWWCGKISEEGVGLRMDKSLTMRRTVSACRERGRSRRAGG